MTKDNGVNLGNIGGLIGAIKENPKLANVTFKAKSVWKGGTRTEATISELYAGGQNIARAGRKFTVAVDEPPELGGTDEHPNPVELVAAGLCGCVTAGIATNAALFKTELEQVEIEVEMDFDIHGVLGLKNDVPNGATELRMKVRLKGSGSEEQLVKAKETIDRKSPVKNTLEMPIRITSEVEVIE